MAAAGIIRARPKHNLLEKSKLSLPSQFSSGCEWSILFGFEATPQMNHEQTDPGDVRALPPFFHRDRMFRSRPLELVWVEVADGKATLK